jgi:glycosyltransferase involved in cell wall biosynthesis
LLVVGRATAVRGEDGAVRIQPADGRYIDEIAEAFAAVDYLGAVIEPHHADLQRKLGPVATYEPRNFRVLALPERFNERGSGPMTAAHRLWRQCRIILREARRADLLFIFLPTFRGALSAIAGRLLGRPVVVYLGTCWSNVARRDRHWPPGLRARLMRIIYVATTWILERSAMHAANARIVTGRSLQCRYAHLRGATLRTPPVVDFDMQLARSLRRRVQAAKGAGRAQKTLLYMGALRPVKNLPGILRAIALLHSRGEQIRLLIAGDGPDEKKTQRLAKELRLPEGQCTLLGYVSGSRAKAQLYAEADALILASHAEGFPRVIYEALAVGLPVVASSLPGIRAEIPAAGISWIDPDSVESIAAGIGHAVRRSPLDPALEQAQKIALQAFATHPANVALHLIREVLGESEATRRPDSID